MPKLKERIKSNIPDLVWDAWRNIQKSSKQKFYNDLKEFIEANPAVNELFPAEAIRAHFSTKVMRDNIFHPDLFLNQIRYFRLYEYFKKHYPDMFEADTRILDVGDPSAVLLRAMKKNGVSLDINPLNVARMKENGIEACEGSIYDLPFEDGSFDYVMSYQCLEHLEAPVLGMKELARVAKKRVFVSIPYQKTTRIYNKTFWDNLVKNSQDRGGWDVTESDRHCDYHIFELSSEDFINLLSYTGMRCEHNYPINYFEPIGQSKINKGTYFNFFDMKVT